MQTTLSVGFDSHVPICGLSLKSPLEKEWHQSVTECQLVILN